LLTNIRAAKGWGVQLAYAPVKVKRVWCLDGFKVAKAADDFTIITFKM
jgi:hypothetical protein